MSFIASFHTVVQETPLGWLILAGGATSTLAALVVAYEARSRRKLCEKLAAVQEAGGSGVTVPGFSFWPELVGTAAALLVPALMVLAVAFSRADMLAITSGEVEPMKVSMAMAAGLIGQLNGLGLGCSLMLLTLPLTAIGLGMTMSARLTRASLVAPGGKAGSGPPPVLIPGVALLLVVLAVIPLLLGVISWVSYLIMSFASAVGVAPTDKVKLILLGMEEARPGLVQAGQVAAAGLALVTCIALAAATQVRPSRDASAPGRLYRFSVAGLVAGAAVMLVLTIPYSQENNISLEVSANPLAVMTEIKGVKALYLEGPDPLVRTPQLTLTAEAIFLEGQHIPSARLLGERLDTMRHNWRLTHPDEDFHGKLTLYAPGDLPAARLQAPLGVAMQAGYATLQLGFQRKEVLQRPLLGEVVIRSGSAALVRLAEGEPDGSSTFGELALAAVRAREQGQKPALAVKKPAAPPPAK